MINLNELVNDIADTLYTLKLTTIKEVSIVYCKSNNNKHQMIEIKIDEQDEDENNICMCAPTGKE